MVSSLLKKLPNLQQILPTNYTKKLFYITIRLKEQVEAVTIFSKNFFPKIALKYHLISNYIKMGPCLHIFSCLGVVHRGALVLSSPRLVPLRLRLVSLFYSWKFPCHPGYTKDLDPFSIFFVLVLTQVIWHQRTMRQTLKWKGNVSIIYRVLYVFLVSNWHVCSKTFDN